MYQSFAIKLDIDTPISLAKLFHLDGLLSSLAVARGRGSDWLPLFRTNEVWHGSAAILETGPFGFLETEVPRLRRSATISARELCLDVVTPARREVGPMSPMRSRLERHRCYSGVRSVWFTGQGIVDEVLDLLQDVRYLGAMGRCGYGRVTQVSLVPLQEQALVGLVEPSGRPLRAIPVRAWEHLQLSAPAGGDVSLQRWCPPYWTGDEELCFAPIQSDLQGTASEIRALIGVRT